MNESNIDLNLMLSGNFILNVPRKLLGLPSVNRFYVATEGKRTDVTNIDSEHQ